MNAYKCIIESRINQFWQKRPNKGLWNSIPFYRIETHFNVFANRAYPDQAALLRTV